MFYNTVYSSIRCVVYTRIRHRGTFLWYLRQLRPLFISPQQYCRRYCSISSEPEALTETEDGARKTKKSKKRRDVMVHSDLKSVLQLYPFLKKRSSAKEQQDTAYILHPKTIDMVVKSARKNLSHETVILESNPGPGFLTKALLEATDCKLKVFEENIAFQENLEVLASEFQHRLTLVKKNLLTLPTLTAKDGHHPEGCIHDIFEGITAQEWKGPPPLLFIGVLSGSLGAKFLRFLIKKLAVMDSFFAYGRAEILAFIPGNEYAYLTAVPKLSFQMYRPITVLYKLLFQHDEIIDQVPKEYFLPPIRHHLKTKAFDTKHMFLVRLSPRKDLFDAVVTKEKLPDLVFFIQQNLFSRNAYVIPNLEKWIPNCGPEFIKKGLSVFTKFGDLSPHEILDVFHTFSSLPEYDYAAFKTAFKRSAYLHFLEHELLDKDEEFFLESDFDL